MTDEPLKLSQKREKPESEESHNSEDVKSESNENGTSFRLYEVRETIEELRAQDTNNHSYPDDMPSYDSNYEMSQTIGPDNILMDK